MNINQDHYTPAQLAQQWGVSYRTIIRMFSNEPGVVKLRSGPPVKGHRRGYTTWRIPREVAERVYRRSTVPGTPASQ